jgi:murein DD-endopeptidase MepM/ murein hydrolase activator NlpD
MEMQNVIGQQYIAHRQKSVRITGDPAFVRPARNGHVSPHFARKSRETHRLVALLPFNPFSKSAASRRSEISIKNTVPAVRVFLKRLESTLVSAGKLGFRNVLRLFLVLAGIVCTGIALAAVGAMERAVNLDSFTLPEDTLLSTVLLDPLVPADESADSEAAAPALPMTVSLSSYKVVKNDTLDAISRRFGIRLDTIISINAITDVRRLVPGTLLKIPNIDGVVHSVRKGENLSTIASARGISVIDLIDANDLASQTIRPGQSLFIPGARLSSYDLKKALGQLVIWPLSGRISSSYGYRPNPFTGIRQFHSGIDIVAAENSTAKAAMSGRVAETGYSALYGNFVILTHPEGYQTLYAHLNKIRVKTGSSIDQGDSVGLIGSTGYSTGTHLHFGVFKNGKAIDPMKLLGNAS